MCTLYRKIARDLNLNAGLKLPTEKWKLMSWIDNQQFDKLRKDMYTDAEREAGLDLYEKIGSIVNDPYLVYEASKVYRVFNKKYQLQQKSISPDVRNSQH